MKCGVRSVHGKRIFCYQLFQINWTVTFNYVPVEIEHEFHAEDWPKKKTKKNPIRW